MCVPEGRARKVCIILLIGYDIFDLYKIVFHGLIVLGLVQPEKCLTGNICEIHSLFKE